MIRSASLLVFAAAALAGTSVLQAQDPEQQAGRRIVATTSLAAKEYAIGVVDGRIVLAPEVEEADLFLRDAQAAVANIPEAIRDETGNLIGSMLEIVARVGDPGALAVLADSTERLLAQHIRGLNETLPDQRPDRMLGRSVYQSTCSACHGELGNGNGERAGEMDPPPSDLTDGEALADQSPLDFYRKVLIGVAGTDMPGHEDVLTEEEIWAVAWYASELRWSTEVAARGQALVEDAQDPSVPLNLQSDLMDPAFLSAQSDDMLAETARADFGVTEGDDAQAVVAFARTTTSLTDSDLPPVLGATRARLERGVRAARSGDADEAASHIFDAYVAFEDMERDLAMRDGALASELEFRFAELRSNAESGSENLVAEYQQLSALLDRAGNTVRPTVSTTGLAVQSFVLLFREGIEALLIVGALAALLLKAGAPERRREIGYGVVAALAASVATAVVFETVFRIGVVQQELLEGITMLAASVVLLFVSYWLISRIEVNRWKEFVAGTGTRAIQSGSRFALMAAAFLAVYREGFETVLFYKALFITADGNGVGAIILGAVVAVIGLGAVYLAIHRFGYRIPIRPFFAVTSAVLMYMAFTFVGKGIAELQGSSLVSTTVLDWAPRVPWMGIYPTMQTLLWQTAILGLIGAGLVWTFLLQPRLARGRA